MLGGKGKGTGALNKNLSYSEQLHSHVAQKECKYKKLTGSKHCGGIPATHREPELLEDLGEIF